MAWRPTVVDEVIDAEWPMVIHWFIAHLARCVSMALPASRAKVCVGASVGHTTPPKNYHAQWLLVPPIDNNTAAVVLFGNMTMITQTHHHHGWNIRRRRQRRWADPINCPCLFQRNNKICANTIKNGQADTWHNAHVGMCMRVPHIGHSHTGHAPRPEGYAIIRYFASRALDFGRLCHRNQSVWIRWPYI